MQVNKYIDSNIPYLKDSDSVQFALDVMASNSVIELPVILNRKYLGMISEDILLNADDLTESVYPGPLEDTKMFIQEDEHVFELIKKMVQSNNYSMAIIGNDGAYMGMANAESVLHGLAGDSSLMEPGGTIVLEMSRADYSLSEIARIVESGDAAVLNTMITSPKDVSQIEVTLKINKTDLEDIIKTFGRYEYVVKAAFHESHHSEALQDRFDSLMHYLNM